MGDAWLVEIAGDDMRWTVHYAGNRADAHTHYAALTAAGHAARLRADTNPDGTPPPDPEDTTP